MQGEEFGRYRLGRLIGSGGMGDVYEAVDTERDRVVALKLLPPLFSGHTEFQERFRRESRVVARLRDPHIIPIHDFGEIDQRLYIDMRLVDSGTSIATLLRDEGPLDPARAVHLVGQAADALDSAHTDGLIHRDVKPSNVLVTSRDFVYVVDFGIAHAVGQTQFGLTLTGSTVGTLDYMAPERFTNGAIDRRVDVYALACLLYQCLTGRTPFEGSEVPALMFAHVHTDPPVPSAVAPEVPAALDEVVATGMAKDPDARYATAGALGEAAYRALDGAATSRPSPRPVATPPRRTKPETVDEPGGPDSPAPHQAVGVVGAAPADPGGGTGHLEPDGAGAPSSSSPPAPERRSPAYAGTPPPLDGPTEPHAIGPPTPPPPPSSSGAAGRARAWVTDPGRRVALLVTAAVLVVVVVAGVIVSLTGGVTPAAAPSGHVHDDAPVTPAASVATPAVVGSVPTPPTPGTFAVAPGAREGWVVNRDPRVLTVLDLATGAPVATIPVPDAPPRFITFAADGSRAYVSAYTDEDAVNVVHVVDTRSRAVVATVPVDRRPYALAMAPDQRTVWVPSHDDGAIDLLDTATDTVTRRIPVAPNPHYIAFNGARAYVANHESNVVSVMDTATASVITTVPVGVSPHALAVSPDGRRVAVANYDGASISFIDTASNRVAATVPVGRGPQFVSYAADGRHLYTANVQDGTVSVIDTGTDAATATLPVCSSPTSVVVVPPDSATVRVSCLDESRLAVLRIAG